ncbi:MAG TPA: Hsp33 family molecular chaperone HslO, partial [Thermoanaerobaculia bacterium]|nr:Hsp33 family molecular chaperone HslO [Thermoanaerobaculia bacterium]
VDYKTVAPGLGTPIRFHCSCTRERALAPFSILDPEELRQMIEEEDGAEAVCQFCGEKYRFSSDDLRAIHANPDA